MVWKDSTTDQWCCVLDKCPHRGAPLSEGKVWADGSLHCSYHGWRFNGQSGQCIAIPQADSAEAEVKACQNPRSCAIPRPIKVAQGKLFIWGGSTTIANPHSIPLPLDSLWAQVEEDTPNNTNNLKPSMFSSRDLMYDYSTLVENVLDPSHVPFSHHKVQGSRDRVKHGMYSLKRDASLALTNNPLEIAANQGGFMGSENIGSLSFIPPSTCHYVVKKPTGEWFSFVVYCVPTTPGRSRLITHQISNFKKLPLPLKIFSLLPRWLDHTLIRNKVLDGDSVLLHEQEHLMADQARKNGDIDSKGWKKEFHMPFQADVMVAAFRNWLDSVNSGPWGPLHLVHGHEQSRLSGSKEEILERFYSHTQQCSNCRNAFKAVEMWLCVLKVVAAAGWIGSLWGGLNAVAGSSGGFHGMVGLIVGVVATFGVKMLSSLRQQMIFVDYVHADI